MLGFCLSGKPNEDYSAGSRPVRAILVPKAPGSASNGRNPREADGSRAGGLQLGGNIVRISPILPVVCVMAALLALAASEGQPWVDRSPESWTLHDAEAVLWESPWVGHKDFRFFHPAGFVQTGKLYARIQSARPIRLALAIAFLGQPEPNVVNVKVPDRRSTEKIAEEIHLPGELVISLIAFPPSFHRRLNEQSFDRLRDQSSLSIGSLKLPLRGYVPPKDTSFGEAWFRFARPEITTDSEPIQFSTRLKVPGNMKVSIEFDPAKLQFQDQLAY